MGNNHEAHPSHPYRINRQKDIRRDKRHNFRNSPTKPEFRRPLALPRSRCSSGQPGTKTKGLESNRSSLLHLKSSSKCHLGFDSFPVLCTFSAENEATEHLQRKRTVSCFEFPRVSLWLYSQNDRNKRRCLASPTITSL